MEYYNILKKILGGDEPGVSGGGGAGGHGSITQGSVEVPVPEVMVVEFAREMVGRIPVDSVICGLIELPLLLDTPHTRIPPPFPR